jgi:probable HAF family extracellular repeat protein
MSLNKIALVIYLVFLGISPISVLAQTKKSIYNTLEDPSEGELSHLPNRVVPYGINSLGEIVGEFCKDKCHGFIYKNGKYTILDAPLGVNGTTVKGINDSGEIVGNYTDSNEKSHGFLYKNSKFHVIDGPLAAGGTTIEGLNNKGEIIGYYTDISKKSRLFIYKNNTFENLNLFLPGGTLAAKGINNAGEIVGQYTDSNNENHGFLYQNGKYTILDKPTSADVVSVEGINDSGSIVGQYRAVRSEDSLTIDHMFVMQNGIFKAINDPQSEYGYGIYPKGINNLGQVVGEYRTSKITSEPFLYNNGKYTYLDANSLDLLFKKSISNSKKKELSKHTEELETLIGKVYGRGVDNNTDLSIYEQIKDSVRESLEHKDEDVKEAIVSTALAQAYKDMGLREDATNTIKNSLNLLRKKNNLSKTGPYLVQALIVQGHLYQDQGNMQSAFNDYKEALNVLLSIKNIVSYKFKVKIVTGNLKGKEYNGFFVYDESLLKGVGEEKIPALYSGFQYQNSYFAQQKNYTEFDKTPLVTFKNRNLNHLILQGGSTKCRYGINEGFGQAYIINQLAVDEDFVKKNGYFGYLDNKTIVDGVGNITYERSSPAEISKLIEIPTKTSCKNQ